MLLLVAVVVLAFATLALLFVTRFADEAAPDPEAVERFAARAPERGMLAASRAKSSSLASGSSAWIVVACCRRLSSRVKFLPHRHAKGFSPVCLLLCVGRRSVARERALKVSRANAKLP